MNLIYSPSIINSAFHKGGLVEHAGLELLRQIKGKGKVIASCKYKN